MNTRKMERASKSREFWHIFEIIEMLNLEIVASDVDSIGSDYIIKEDDEGKPVGIHALPNHNYEVVFRDKSTDQEYFIPRPKMFEFLIDFAKIHASEEVQKDVSIRLNIAGVLERQVSR